MPAPMHHRARWRAVAARIAVAAVVMALPALTGCAISPRPLPASTAALFGDAQLAATPKPPGLDRDVFAPSPAMRAWAATVLAPRVQKTGPRIGLFEAVRDDLQVRYDASRTRDAADAFSERSGNCLSLVILTAAFARELGLAVRFQHVYGNDTWSRSVNGLEILSEHVNVTLGTRGPANLFGSDNGTALTIDFLLAEEGQMFRSRVLDEATLVAMYRNNRAAEALAADDAPAAYWWARTAVSAAPDYIPAYNTLGVAYRRQGRPALAEQALREALRREPGNAMARSNLAGALDDLGRGAEARALRAELARLGDPADAPFQHYDQGLAALRHGDYVRARDEFRRELRARPYDHEVLFALGLAYMQLGDGRRAERYVREALENSTTTRSEGIYAAKLAKIQAAASLE